MGGKITAWVVAILIVLLYAYLVVAAVGNIIGLTQMAALIGLGLTPFGWFWLVAGIALPVVVFVIAVLVGRRRTALPRLLVLAAGVALVAAVQLEIMHLVPQANFFA